jgi:uncharacterized membrane protein
VGLLASAGAAIAGYLTYTRYTNTTIACVTGGCEKVQSSDYAEIAGLPIALLGLGAFVFLLVTSLSSSGVARSAGAAVAIAGALYAAYLILVQVVVIEAVCQWCVASDVLTALLAVVCTLRLRKIRTEPPA